MIKMHIQPHKHVLKCTHTHMYTHAATAETLILTKLDNKIRVWIIAVVCNSFWKI